MDPLVKATKKRTQHNMLSLLRRRASASLLASQLSSRLGDGAMFVALTLYVLTKYHSATMLAGVVAARLIPYGLFVLFGGALVDRFSRRRALFLSHAFRAVLTFVMFFVAEATRVYYVEILSYAALFGIGDCIFDPALSAFIPEIIEPAALPAMNAALPLITNGAGSIAGPALGGVLLAWSFNATLFITGALFALGAVSLLLTPHSTRPRVVSTHSILHDIVGGIKYVFTTPWLSYSMVGYTVLNSFVFAPIPVLVPFFLRTVLHASNAVVDASFVVEGVAGIIAALIATRLRSARHRVRAMWLWWGASAALAGLLAIAVSKYEVLFFAALSFIPFIIGNVLWNTTTQVEVPSALRGRMTSIDYLFAYGFSPLGILLATLIASVLGVRTYFLLAALLALFSALFIIFSKKANAIDTNPRNPATTVASRRRL